MFPSIFTDELGLDITQGLPIIKSWGLKHVDLRGLVFGKAAEALPPERLPELRKLLDDHGMKVGCLESSLAKVHLPDAAGCRAEEEKLEGIIRAADALDCRLVRAFFYWQPRAEELGNLAIRPDEQQKVLDRFGPVADRARQAGLTLAFENCGMTPDEVFTILDILGVPGWGLAWDCCNSWNCDERRRDEDAYIRRMVQRARLVHVKASHAVPGTAEEIIPYAKILQACDNVGMAGPVSAETHNPDRSATNTEMSRRTVEVIQKAWPSAAPGAVLEKASDEGVLRPWADDPVRFVVVGLGMGHGRSMMITKTPGARLVGVCDVVEERAKRTGEACGVPYATDLRRWLDDDQVEAVFVLTETGRHGEVGMQALQAGKHVLTTKPMDACVEACDEMIRLAEAKGLLLGVDHERRHVSSVRALKAAVAAGRFGRLLSGNCHLKVLRTMEYFNANGAWRGTRRWDGGGVLSNQAVHNVDEVAFTLGIPARVRANVWTQSHPIEAEDLGTADWLYENGMVLTFFATTSYPHSTWYYQYEVGGSEGAYFEAAGGPFEQPRIRWFFDGAWSEQPPVAVEPAWLNSADNFAAAIRSGAELACSGRDGRRTRAILDAMYHSAYQCGGGWVDVRPEVP